MAQSIGNLVLGSKIKDSKGQTFIVVSKNHYKLNEVTLLCEHSALTSVMYSSDVNSTSCGYEQSEVHYYLKNTYPELLSKELLDRVETTDLTYIDPISFSQNIEKTVKTKFFIPSIKEYGFETEINNDLFKKFDYFKIANDIKFKDLTWSRSEIEPYRVSKARFYSVYIDFMGKLKYTNPYSSASCLIRPCFNLSFDTLVSDTVQDGYYSFVFNNPPTIHTIGNIKGNYGKPTNITYTATDSDDSELTHYISFDNGEAWNNIKPSRIGDTYTYTHIFNELKNYNCRVKVVDSAYNEVVSNMFTVSVNSVAPTVAIVGVNKQVVTFKVNCITEAISKVEIFVNSSLKHTFRSGFDFNMTYEINRGHLSSGRNTIEIRATSSSELVGSKMLEANKTSYNLPPAGTKVIIGNSEYAIESASQSGSNQVYTINGTLSSNIEVGELIKIVQDSVKVKCALSNVSNQKEFKEMKLVKAKKLKGQFEGYVEEKYELEGEGRYSTIKIEAERFNNNIASEIIELQQYFDYMED